MQNGRSHVQFEGGSAALDETFAQSGSRLLRERAKKLFEWRDDVLKHEDIEAVHKMRVASRRLRATLDAYEPCCEPKQFKKVYRTVQHIADMLGRARDTDVMLQGLQRRLTKATSEEQAGVAWLIERLNAYRQQTQDELSILLLTLDEDALQRDILKCIKEGAARNGKS